jgi:hypothetical protein
VREERGASGQLETLAHYVNAMSLRARDSSAPDLKTAYGNATSSHLRALAKDACPENVHKMIGALLHAANSGARNVKGA